jgi:indolepyruvate ferredoxin oxidoreductase beta subunit
MSTARRPVSVLVAALGGQGGGVLTDWIVAAAEHAGLPVQATSIPGVAQRTGATTYYLEVYPEALPAGAAQPVFSLYPMPGDVDVIMASELLEAGRAVEMDYASPERTTLIMSTHRLFAIGEKTALGNGIFPADRVREAASALTRRLIACDALAVARAAGSEVNAVLMGALAASGALPLVASDFETAIREGGVAVERNLAGFKAGMEIAAGAPAPERASAPPWSEVKAERARALGSRGRAFLSLVARIEEEFAAGLQATLGEAIARLVDYQGPEYAERFLDRVRRVRAGDAMGRLTERFARRLALWMAYEDAIRVADLKTRASRFARIRREHGAEQGEVLTVTDYLKPDLDEIYGILPASIGGPIARWCEARWPERRPTLGQHVRTTSILGFARVWSVGRLRFLRPSSLRAQREFALIDRWQEAVLDALVLDYDLACEVTEMATVIRGYGEVRRRLSAAFVRFLEDILTPAVSRDRAAGRGYARARDLTRSTREKILADEKGLEQALLEAARS